MTKLTLTLSASFLAIFAGSLVFVARQETRFTNEMAMRNNHVGAHSLTTVYLETRARHGTDEADALLRQIDRAEPRIGMRKILLPDAELGLAGTPGLQALLDDAALAQLDRGQLVHRIDGDAQLRTYQPMRGPDGRVGEALELTRQLDPGRDHLHLLVTSLLAIFVLALLAGVAVTALIGRRLLGAPIEALVAQANAIGRGDLSARSGLQERRDELAQLALALDAMAGSLERARQAERAARLEAMSHAERLATVGRLASGVAHEIRTPLQVIAMRTEILERHGAHAELFAQSVANIREQTRAIERIVNDTLGFVRHRKPRREVRDLVSLIEHDLELLRTAGRDPPIEMVLDAPEAEHLEACVDAGQLRQVLSNLVLNAVQSMPHGGRITVRLSREQRRPPRKGIEHDDFVRLDVIDEGSGIPAEVLPRLFEPFFTTKTDGQGTGLGLAICKGIVEEHGGFIEVDSQPGRGTTFSVFLPALEDDPPDRAQLPR